MSTHTLFQNSLQFGSYLSRISPSTQPVRWVESCNLLDQPTHGRTLIGMGSGLVSNEFLAFGRDATTRSSLSPAP